jgi:flavorubredoxin
MCHWPDSMMVHVGSAGGPGVLLSNDAFGQHYTSAFFDDEAADGRLWFEAEKYFANIISPYCRNVLQRLDELEKLALPIGLIAPSHGTVWREGAAEVLAAYRRWAEQRTEPRAAVCYDTMYESTRQMADAACAGLADQGIAYTLHHLPSSDRSDVLTDLFGARGFLIGSSTWHMNVLPTVATLLEDLRTLRFKDRLVGAFGSYGWQKANVAIIERRAAEAGLDVPVPGVACRWKPRGADLESCRAFGREFAGHVKKVKSD